MDPIILGRFNYLTVKAEKYNVLFFPFRGTNCTIVARDLPKEDALTLVSDLNGAIDDTRRDIQDLDSSEEM